MWALVTMRRVHTKAEAELLKDQVVEGTSEVVKVHPYGKRCPKGWDHSHATYEGATYCPGCGRYLTLRLEKKL